MCCYLISGLSYLLWCTFMINSVISLQCLLSTDVAERVSSVCVCLCVSVHACVSFHTSLILCPIKLASDFDRDKSVDHSSIWLCQPHLSTNTYTTVPSAGDRLWLVPGLTRHPPLHCCHHGRPMPDRTDRCYVTVRVAINEVVFLSNCNRTEYMEVLSVPVCRVDCSTSLAWPVALSSSPV